MWVFKWFLKVGFSEKYGLKCDFNIQSGGVSNQRNCEVVSKHHLCCRVKRSINRAFVKKYYSYFSEACWPKCYGVILVLQKKKMDRIFTPLSLLAWAPKIGSIFRRCASMCIIMMLENAILKKTLAWTPPIHFMLI